MVSPIVWKEWREQRWFVAFGTVMLLSFAGIATAARVVTADEAAIATCMIGGTILTLMSAMGVYASEHTNRTKTFLMSRPLDPRKVFLWKWFFGWFNIIVPLAATAMLVLVLGGWPRGPWIPVLRSAGVMVLCMTNIYSLICCWAPRRASEAQVGLFGLGVLVACLLHIVVVINVLFALGSRSTMRLPTSILLSINPLYLFQGVSDPWAGTLKIGIPVQLALLAVTLLHGLRTWERSA